MEKKLSVGREEEDGGKVPSNPKRKKQKSEDEGEEERSPDRHGGGGISVTLIDPEVLDCSICMESLIPPIFQCKNGHIVCSSCCTNLKKKCPSCSRPIGYSRCLSIEKVLESIEISCPNLQYGCKERVRYTKKRHHEVTCIYAPSECPFLDCTFHGSFEQFSLHFNSKHLASVRCFHYDRFVTVSLGKNEQVLVFKGEEDGLLLLLNNCPELNGNAVSMTCIGPSSPKGRLLYSLQSRRGDTTLRLQSFTESSKGQRESSSIDYLLVPCHFNGCNGQLELEVCIFSGSDVSAHFTGLYLNVRCSALFNLAVNVASSHLRKDVFHIYFGLVFSTFVLVLYGTTILFFSSCML